MLHIFLAFLLFLSLPLCATSPDQLCTYPSPVLALLAQKTLEFPSIEGINFHKNFTYEQRPLNRNFNLREVLQGLFSSNDMAHLYIEQRPVFGAHLQHLISNIICLPSTGRLIGDNFGIKIEHIYPYIKIGLAYKAYTHEFNLTGEEIPNENFSSALNLTIESFFEDADRRCIPDLFFPQELHSDFLVQLLNKPYRSKYLSFLDDKTVEFILKKSITVAWMYFKIIEEELAELSFLSPSQIIDRALTIKYKGQTIKRLFEECLECGDTDYIPCRFNLREKKLFNEVLADHKANYARINNLENQVAVFSQELNFLDDIQADLFTH